MKTIYSLQTTSEPTFVCTYIKQTKKHGQFDLCDGSRTIATLPNAGGTSVISETLSFEMLNRMYAAKLQATEMELRYYPLGSKITDYSVSIYGETIGVSVTRAMKFKGIFSDEDGVRLLTKKLDGVICSSKAVIKQYRWKKQILHIWAETKDTAKVLERVYFSDAIPQSLKSSTIVMVSVWENAPFVFYDRV